MRGGKRAGAGRPRRPATQSVTVRLSVDEVAALNAIDPSPSRAIHRILAERVLRVGKQRYVLTGEGTQSTPPIIDSANPRK